MDYPYLAIDQHGNKTIIPDHKYSTLRDELGGSNSCRIQKMFTDFKSDRPPAHIGFVIGQGRGNYPLWVTLYQIIRLEDVEVS